VPGPLKLPDGYAERPLVPSDAAAVTSVIAAQELEDVGEVVIEEADIVAEWQRPSYDVSASSVGVLDPDGRLVAYAEVTGGDRGDAAVLPDHRGLGVGSELARWMQECAREQGSSVIGMPVPQGSPGDRLLEQLAYHIRWNSWVLELPEGATVPERPLPEGYSVGEAASADYEAFWGVTEDAFLEWSVRERQSFEDWEAEIPKRPGFEPWQLRVVVDAGGEVVATAALQMTADGSEGFIARLATRKDQRGRGLAQALLVDAFAASRAHGATKSSLSTDSRTGALGLYEKVGMVVTSTWVNRAIAL
jgi:mycothiol synthase